MEICQGRPSPLVKYFVELKTKGFSVFFRAFKDVILGNEKGNSDIG